jgi:hypothetical protein
LILPFSFLLLSIGIYAGIIENFERSIIAKLIFVLFVLYDLANMHPPPGDKDFSRSLQKRL